MRPVNLIPPEDRRGESAPSRTGGLAYVVVGVLAIVARRGDRRRHARQEGRRPRGRRSVALEAEQAAARRPAPRASPPSSRFQQIRDARVETIDSLARSRFDWERVMRELSDRHPRGRLADEPDRHGLARGQVDDGDGGRAAPRLGARPGAGADRLRPQPHRRRPAGRRDGGHRRGHPRDGVRPRPKERDGGGGERRHGRRRMPDPRRHPAFQPVAAFDEVPVADAAAAPRRAAPPTAETAPVDGGVASRGGAAASSEAEVAGRRGRGRGRHQPGAGRLR